MKKQVQVSGQIIVDVIVDVESNNSVADVDELIDKAQAILLANINNLVKNNEKIKIDIPTGELLDGSYTFEIVVE